MALDPAVLEALIQAGDELWKRHRIRRGGTFHGFVPADYHGAYRALRDLRELGDSFIELGSGAGVITIIADLLGFEAAGVEIEPWLVESSEELAIRFDSEAQFYQGSFLPAGWQDRVDPDFQVTYDNADSIWDELDLDDFDVIYAFPWPGEEQMFHDLVSQHARSGAIFLSYHADEGFVVRQL